jgi:hypothetical protein
LEGRDGRFDLLVERIGTTPHSATSQLSQCRISFGLRNPRIEILYRLRICTVARQLLFPFSPQSQQGLLAGVLDEEIDLRRDAYDLALVVGELGFTFPRARLRREKFAPRRLGKLEQCFALGGDVRQIVREQISADCLFGFGNVLLEPLLARYPDRAVQDLRIVARAPVPLEDAPSTEFVVFSSGNSLRDQIAIVVGPPDPARPVLTRLHSACLTGDLFASLKCDCGDQLRLAVQAINAAGSGLLLYLDQMNICNITFDG